MYEEKMFEYYITEVFSNKTIELYLAHFYQDVKTKSLTILNIDTYRNKKADLKRLLPR